MTRQTDERWLLPEGIAEVLPAQAKRLELLRRRLLDLYHCWGYDLVMPPFIEYMESLLVGTGHDLALQTFTLTDQLTGRLMGVRADMTPQVARIDAHMLRREAPTRLCYIGTVLHTRPDGFAGSRSPLQVGVELYGNASIESDLEVLRLLVETLKASGIEQPYIDLGHVDIFRSLVKQASMDADQEAEFFDALQRKAKPELQELLTAWQLDNQVAGMLLSLADLHGGVEILQQARNSFTGADKSVLAALNDMATLADRLQQEMPELTLHFDLGELRGYNYHTGVVFAAYLPGQGQAIALGGRYDHIGEVFGRARPATGFSTDLKQLMQLGEAIVPPDSKAVFAPHSDDTVLQQTIKTLREDGRRVICALPDQKQTATDMGCDEQLVNRNGQWQVETI
jgi:ATP phosphoribosyltransferase regulatory subunit